MICNVPESCFKIFWIIYYKEHWYTSVLSPPKSDLIYCVNSSPDPQSGDCSKWKFCLQHFILNDILTCHMDIRRRAADGSWHLSSIVGEELDKWLFVHENPTAVPLVSMEFYLRGGSAQVSHSGEGKPAPAHPQPCKPFDGCGKHITDRKRRANTLIPYPHFQAPFSFP